MIHYRCSYCRVRNSFKHPLNWYIRERKCRSCGYKKFYWDKERNASHSHETCYCNGYWFPHRRGSKFCEGHPLSPLYVAIHRYKVTDEEVLSQLFIDCTWDLRESTTRNEI